MTCALAGKIAVHKRVMMSDEKEIRVFIDRRWKNGSLLEQRAVVLSSVAAKKFVAIRLSFAADTGDS